jgi:hypothetical protein
MVSGIAQLMGFWVPEEALSLQPGTIDYDPATSMTVSIVQSGPNGLVMEETNNINYKLTAYYDASGKVVQTDRETYSGTATGRGMCCSLWSRGELCLLSFILPAHSKIAGQHAS